jgi:hypothetical protein
MIGATYPVLALVGSNRNLGGALSNLVPVAAQSPSAAPRHRCSTPLDQRETARSKMSDWIPEWKTPQKPI